MTVEDRKEQNRRAMRLMAELQNDINELAELVAENLCEISRQSTAVNN